MIPRIGDTRYLVYLEAWEDIESANLVLCYIGPLLNRKVGVMDEHRREGHKLAGFSMSPAKKGAGLWVCFYGKSD